MIVPRKCQRNDLVEQYEKERGNLTEKESSSMLMGSLVKFARHPELNTMEKLFSKYGNHPSRHEESVPIIGQQQNKSFRIFPPPIFPETKARNIVLLLSAHSYYNGHEKQCLVRKKFIATRACLLPRLTFPEIGFARQNKRL